MNSSLMRQYLLGRLSAEERAEVEEQYFGTSDSFEEVVALENDLVDSYVRGELPDSEQMDFEREYRTSPDRRARIEFARTLRAVSEPQAKSAAPAERVTFWKSLQRSLYVYMPRPSPHWAVVAAAGAIIIVGGSWLIVQNRRLHAELSRARTEQHQLYRDTETIRQQIADLRPQPTPGTPENEETQVARAESRGWPEVRLQLFEGTVRSAGTTNLLRLPPTKSMIRLELQPPDQEYSSYEALLQRVESNGQERLPAVESFSSGSRTGTIIVNIPSTLFQNGDYIVHLSGRTGNGNLEEIGAYTFRVVQP